MPKLDIQFADGEAAEFYPGQLISGKIILNITKTTKIRGVYLSIVGKEKVNWKQGSGGGGAGVDRYRAEHSNIDETISLSEEKQELQPGQFEYPFEYRLPDDCPPSYHSNRCDCMYYISANADIPMRRDIKNRKDFQILMPQADRARLTEVISISSDNKDKTIKISVDMRNTAFYAGTHVGGTVALQNHSDKKISNIKVELLCQEYARACGGLFSKEKTEIIELDYKENRTSLSKKTAGRYKGKFSLIIPESAPATCSWHKFDIKAFLKFSLEVSWGRNVTCFQEIHILPTQSP